MVKVNTGVSSCEVWHAWNSSFQTAITEVFFPAVFYFVSSSFGAEIDLAILDWRCKLVGKWESIGMRAGLPNIRYRGDFVAN